MTPPLARSPAGLGKSVSGGDAFGPTGTHVPDRGQSPLWFKLDFVTDTWLT